jgi:hypothetical protein
MGRYKASPAALAIPSLYLSPAEQTGLRCYGGGVTPHQSVVLVYTLIFTETCILSVAFNRLSCSIKTLMFTCCLYLYVFVNIMLYHMLK